MSSSNARPMHGFMACVIALLGVLGAGLALAPAQAWAQDSRQVQELTGEIEPGLIDFYRLAGLEEGQVLYTYVEGVSGNLDPIVGVLPKDADLQALLTEGQAAVADAVATGEDPVAALETVRSEQVLAQDDDSGEGYDAALTFVVPADDDYVVVVANALTSLGRDAYGRYRLLVGLNAPEVLNGRGQPTGDTIAVLDREASLSGVAVQEVSGTLSEEKRDTFYVLNEVKAGDTIYAYVEATSGNLAPVPVLKDFGDKPLAGANVLGAQSSGALQYTFPEDGENFRLTVESCCGKERVTVGDFRLLVGLNAPEVLDGQAEPIGSPILRLPLVVRIGINLQQITGVDQKSENYGAVASLTFDWRDTRLAFNPDTCNCRFKTYAGKQIDDFVDEVRGRWPEFTLFNQQGNRWTQNRVVLVRPDGSATYFERFSTAFQAPDFDFRKFPFDNQEFYIRVDSLYPKEYLTYSAAPEYNRIGDQLGEEEWYISDSGTTITTVSAVTGNTTSRFSFRFEARRHLVFYVFRIFVPLGLIILVAWITFFLKDYGKRIEATSANLLLFIAFNFTVGGELPRLGYLTFLDTVLIATFIISVLVVVYNVYLKRLEVTGRVERAKRVDAFMIWFYPLGYALAFGVVTLMFFVWEPGWIAGTV